jgi:hypothetical protein
LLYPTHNAVSHKSFSIPHHSIDAVFAGNVSHKDVYMVWHYYIPQNTMTIRLQRIKPFVHKVITVGYSEQWNPLEVRKRNKVDPRVEIVRRFYCHDLENKKVSSKKGSDHGIKLSDSAETPPGPCYAHGRARRPGWDERSDHGIKLSDSAETPSGPCYARGWARRPDWDVQ